MTKRPANICDCGQPATTKHAGGKCCQRCKEFVSAAQAALDEHIRKSRASDNEWVRDDTRKRIAERQRADPAWVARRRTKERMWYAKRMERERLDRERGLGADMPFNAYVGRAA